MWLIPNNVPVVAIVLAHVISMHLFWSIGYSIKTENMEMQIICHNQYRRNSNCEIFTLFSDLGIPPQEQTILLEMAKRNIGCIQLKNILLQLKTFKKVKFETI